MKYYIVGPGGLDENWALVLSVRIDRSQPGLIAAKSWIYEYSESRSKFTAISVLLCAIAGLWSKNAKNFPFIEFFQILFGAIEIVAILLLGRLSRVGPGSRLLDAASVILHRPSDQVAFHI